MKIKMITASLFVSMMLHAVNVGEVLPPVVLDKDNGGDSKDNAWHSKNLQGKVHVLLYMDPDEREGVKSFTDTLNSKKYAKSKYSTVTIVNLAATWMPDSILQSKLSKKQKELQNTEFVFDKTKYFVKKWQMKDDASNVLVLDKDMKVLYQKSGTLSNKDEKKILAIVEKQIH